MLSDTIHKPIYFSQSTFEDVFQLKYSTPTRPLYSRLMNESENFMAEQLSKYVPKIKQINIVWQIAYKLRLIHFLLIFLKNHVGSTWFIAIQSLYPTRHGLCFG